MKLGLLLRIKGFPRNAKLSISEMYSSNQQFPVSIFFLQKQKQQQTTNKQLFLLHRIVYRHTIVHIFTFIRLSFQYAESKKKEHANKTSQTKGSHSVFWREPLTLTGKADQSGQWR